MRPSTFHLAVCWASAACLQVVGILSLFFLPVPLFLKQCYTVWVGICVAYIFTHVPEWTSWVLLVIMALYDLAAVLLPGGPLKVGGRHPRKCYLDEAHAHIHRQYLVSLGDRPKAWPNHCKCSVNI